MKLNQVDSDRCCDLLAGLDFLAIEYYNIKKARTKELTDHQILNIRKRWQNSDNKHFIETFIQYANLNDEDANLVRSWMYIARGTFIIKSQTPTHTIAETVSGQEFGLIGLGQGIPEVLNLPLPVLAKTIVLPYKDVIIYDGIIEATPLSQESLEELRLIRERSHSTYPEKTI